MEEIIVVALEEFKSDYRVLWFINSTFQHCLPFGLPKQKK